ncbi:MAG: hypothetical protein J0I06_03005 [Planctomycetes bacterium]|nr:hypothetical protein [Planctomycetota bacterium]
MSAGTWRRGWPLAGAVALAAVVGLVAPSNPASAQKPELLVGKAGPLPKDISPGISACATCHSGADQRSVNLFVTLHKSHEFIKFDESHTWRGQDVHAIAHLALSGPLGKQMGEDLGYDVAKAPQCLTCHALDLTPTAPLAEKQFFATQGVNCTGCHGTKETWQVRHYKEAADGSGIAWRAMTPAEKAEAGLADLRNPAVRAKKCVSCHIGNPDEGKVVTHEMFSAGHPPLPPFELVTFQESEPRHWGYPSELPYFKNVPANKTWPLYRFHPADRESYHARQMAAGAVAALRAEAQKLLAEAREAQKPDADGMDYAAFDCYACHHELRSKSDRQSRTTRDGRGGRPTVRKAAGALAGVFAGNAAGIEVGGLKARAAGFDEKWAELRAAVVSKTFGRPQRIATAAADVIRWCDGFLNVLEECPQPIYTKEQTDRLLPALAAATERTTADPDGALCLSWAYLSLRKSARGSHDQERLREFARAVPPSVRVAPFAVMEKEKWVPIAPRYGDRMDWVADFETHRFRAAFKSAVGSR